MAAVALSAALADRLAAALPPPVERRETHGSWVLLSGDRAYKLRKPVRLPFLDYSTAELRRAASEQEVAVNGPLAGSIYLGVRPVVETEEGPAIGPGGGEAVGRVVDWVVEMRRFDERRTLAALCLAGQARGEDVDAVGRRLAAFHADAERCEGDGCEAFAARVRADLDQLEAVAGASGAPEALAVAPLRAYAEAALARRGAELRRRAAAGLRRDGHGDLRAEHVVLSDELLVVDRLEFDRRLRCTDVGSDLAFLAMDLERLGARWAAQRLTAAYREASRHGDCRLDVAMRRERDSDPGRASVLDPGGPRLRALFAWQRAMVRAKVALIRGDAGEAVRLRELAEALAWRERAPGVLLVAGPPASGKSTLAAELGRRTSLPVVSTDLVRKRLHAARPSERLPAAAYGDDVTRRVYERVGVEAAAAAAEHGGAIVDATARTAALRRVLLDALSAGSGDERAGGRDRARGEIPDGVAPVVAVTCEISEETRAARARERSRDPERVSDADAGVAARLAASFEPVGDEPGIALAVRLRTDRPLESTVDELAAALDRAAS